MAWHALAPFCSFEIKGGDKEDEASTATPGPQEGSAAPPAATPAATPAAAEGNLSEEQVASGRLWSAKVVLVGGINPANLQVRGAASCTMLLPSQLMYELVLLNVARLLPCLARLREVPVCALCHVQAGEKESKLWVNPLKKLTCLLLKHGEQRCWQQ